MIYVIDHKDSFTHNVVHQLSLFDEVRCTNYDEINNRYLKTASTIVLSPGPGSPKDYPETSKIYNKYKGKKKMIGVCLGFQLILYNEGGKIIQQNNIYHGYQSKIKVNGKSKIFKKNKVFNVGRYHSLKLHEPYFSKNLNITMRCTKTNTAMAFEDSINQIYGFQFHPDSFLTENGNFFIKKILSSK